METYALALGLTLLVELPIVWLCVPRGRRRKSSTDIVCVNLVTHPIGWVAVLHLGLQWTPVELLVIVVEALIYRGVTRLSVVRAVVAAVLANTASALLSFAVNF